MLQWFSKYRFFIAMQAPLLLVATTHSSRFPLLGNPLLYLVCEAAIIAVQLKYNFNRSIQNRIIQEHNDKLLIRGVFGRKELTKEGIMSIQVSRGFVCRIFDWSRVDITTTDGRISMYTERITDAGLEFKL